MAAIMDPIPDLRALAQQPLFEPVAEWLRSFGGAAPPHVGVLNSALAALTAMPRATSGAAIRFVPPGGFDGGYEERVFARGEVETRAGNWHDFFNALAWLAYPRAKCVLNGRHHAALMAQRAAGRHERGAVRDAVTQFDECGLVVACADMALLDLLRGHEWKELFWQRRAQVARDMRFFVFGHASWDQLRAPFVGLTAKAVLLEVEPAWLAQQVEAIDGRLAELFSQAEAYARPRDFQPLPLLGIPGVVAENSEPSYYDDTRQFRAPRKKGPA
jgi:hypothetical protein